jgi:GSH-dependent disulfide-bond oxidoreductase
MNRLYGVMNERLKDRRFLAGSYSIADMACVGWVRHAERHGETFKGFPHLKRWLAAMQARPTVQYGMHIPVEEASRVDINDPKVRAVLFGQRAK